MPAPTPKTSGISQFLTKHFGAIPRDVIAVDAPINVVSSSVANPTIITVAKTHGYTEGQIVVITGHSGSDDDAAVNAAAGVAVNVISRTTFSIPVDLTGGGGTGGTVVPKVATGVLEVTLPATGTPEGAEASDQGPLQSAAVAGPSVTNTERTSRTRGDNDGGLQANGKLLVSASPVIPRRREHFRIRAALEEVYGARYQRIRVRYEGDPEG